MKSEETNSNKFFAVLAMGALSISGSISQAHWYCLGPYKEPRLLSQTTRPIEACKQTELLTLGRMSHVYPALGYLEVDAWYGAYSFSERTHSVYRVDVYGCDGYLQNSYDTSTDEDSLQTFSVDNPNLHDDVAQSFVANAPMTNGEAVKAMAVAKQQCEAAQLK